MVKLAPAVGTTVPPAPEDPFQQTQKQQREQSSQEQLGDEAERTESGMSAHTEGTVAIIGWGWRGAILHGWGLRVGRRRMGWPLTQGEHGHRRQATHGDAQEDDRQSSEAYPEPLVSKPLVH